MVAAVVDSKPCASCSAVPEQEEGEGVELAGSKL